MEKREIPDNRLPSSIENKKGQINTVGIVPRGKIDSGRWKRFKSWLSEVFQKSKEPVRDEAQQYIDEAILAGHAKLQLEALKVDEKKADIANKLAQAEKTKADAEKTRIEARFLDLNSKIQLLKELHEIGVEVHPVFDEGKLTDLYLTKTSETKSALLPVSDKKEKEDGSEEEVS